MDKPRRLQRGEPTEIVPRLRRKQTAADHQHIGLNPDSSTEREPLDAISITPDSTFEEFTRSVSAPLKPSAIRLPLQIASLLLGMGAVITLIETWGSFAGVAAVIAAISGLAIFVLSQSLASSRLKACYLAGKDDAATYAFSESGVTGACKCTRTDFSWAAFDRVLESETMYVLVTKSLACIRVPKRNIPSDRVDQFVALISERVGAPIQIK